MTPQQFNALYAPDSARPHNGESPPTIQEVDLPTDTRYRAATFIETYTGRAFWPLAPKPEHISIIDIAHHLSNQCRYSGAVRYFYSVAQHCCLLAVHVGKGGGSALECLQVLMHDAPEAYLVDVPRPVKQYMPQYRTWDHTLDKVIRQWMGWENIPRPTYLDDLDTRVIVDERAALMSHSGNDWGHRMEPVGVTIEPWTPQEAERHFLMLYAAYTKEVYGFHNYINYEWGLPVNTLHQTSSDVLGVADVMEVDVRGGVARIARTNQDGTLVRDVSAGLKPSPEWYWEHGKFEVMEKAA